MAAVEKIEDRRKPDDFFGHRNRDTRGLQKIKIRPLGDTTIIHHSPFVIHLFGRMVSAPTDKAVNLFVGQADSACRKLKIRCEATPTSFTVHHSSFTCLTGEHSSPLRIRLKICS